MAGTVTQKDGSTKKEKNDQTVTQKRWWLEKEKKRKEKIMIFLLF